MILLFFSKRRDLKLSAIIFYTNNFLQAYKYFKNIFSHAVLFIKIGLFKIILVLFWFMIDKILIKH